MRIARLALLPLLLAALTSRALTQALSSPPGPTFDVVSIKLNTTGNLPTGPPVERPDGGLRMTRVPVSVLIARAYPPAVPIEMVGLPDWAKTEHYDVIATSTLSSATRDDRIAMLRAMLADRFKLIAHVETREQPAYDLVLARRDGRLGPGITPLDVDCDAQMAAPRAAAEAARSAGTPPPTRPDFSVPPPPCTLRTVGAMLRDGRGDRTGTLGDLLEGEATMATLAMALRPWARRMVVNKTGLSGSYRVRMNFDMMAAVRGPDTGTPAQDAAPTIFTAIQEQLGLKLESSRALSDVLIIDHLERPTAD
jgi:uncharacterized protein (TIGR03435 family)